MRTIFVTDKGKIRQHNEDSGGIFYSQSGHRLAIVADGMGGHRAGDVASKMALIKLQEEWEKTSMIETAEQAENWLSNHIHEVNLSLYEHSKNNPECEGMGTTIVAAIITELFATIAHIGDSRCYILNESGFSQVTEDHSLVNELVRSGEITKEDAENHPRKNVLLRALGTETSVEMDIKTILFEEGDRLLLCSDGLSNKVSETEIVDILQTNFTIDEKANRLIKLANDNGGEDNITLIIVEYYLDGFMGDVQ
ncbi:Stp1/IreP family PP2C-type Ser/Thr phosphatase [Bacillus tuaregi]|uniref:Stp1/IreP family PP2C-type Ser/Thr phosphatase n=1 Tax=Bacillus tuaregi TaxID=1816695 RepID=UPI0008F96703|nr:Stp1/IreP family PP2C-type Ser/Thr phosphatase [Bacillus tuaregi]